MKKQLLISALVISACAAGLAVPTHEVRADDGNSVEGLPPIVMILFDTSGSMDYCFEDANGQPVGDKEYFCQHYESEKCENGTYSSSASSTKFGFVNEDCSIVYSDGSLTSCHPYQLQDCKGVKKGCSHTRLTKAIQEIAGAPKRTGLNRLIRSNEQSPVRAYFSCDNNSCSYDYAAYPAGAQTAGKADSAYTTGSNISQLIGENGEPLKWDGHWNNSNGTNGKFNDGADICSVSSYHYCVSKVDDYDEIVKNGLDKLDDAYNNDGVIQAYKANVKFGFSGFDYTGNTNYVFGKGGCDTISKKYKTKNFGISNSDPLSQAPLMYPSAKDDMTSIMERNNAVATSVRGYWAGGGTPIGPALADIRHIFVDAVKNQLTTENCDNAKYQRYEEDAQIKRYIDDKYNCRDKAVILITDGAPSPRYGVTGDDEEGQGARVWEDVYRLYKEHIKTYVVGYSIKDINPRKQPKLIEKDGKLKLCGPEDNCPSCEKNIDDCDINAPEPYKNTTEDLDDYAGDILNRLAWKGGTCRNPKSQEIIKPDDTESYKALLAQCPDVKNEDETNTENEANTDSGDKGKYWECSCFYNASTSTGLRTALVTVLSDMLKGTYSKTKITTSTAISQLEKTTGMYSVYSGYRVTSGAIRQTKLEREAMVCDTQTGTFKQGKYLDYAHRLKCQLTSCDIWRPAVEGETNKIPGMTYKYTDDTTQKRAGYGSDFNNSVPTPCAPQATGLEAATNTCLTNRYIFAADYLQKKDKYAISLFPGDINPQSDTDNLLLAAPLLSENVGKIPTANYSDTNRSYTDHLLDPQSACSASITKDTSSYAEAADYILSPYECYNDLDCGMSGNETRRCDLGRCLEPAEYAAAKKCNEATDLSANEVCVAGIAREKSDECTSHESCNPNFANNPMVPMKVCHAGVCVDGTIKSCDIRQFIASQPLGTIEYATPVAVNPPRMAYKSTEYREFKDKYKTRDTMLMVGANDGMLHAFILGKNNATGYKSLMDDAQMPNFNKYTSSYDMKEDGDEIWAFMPKNLLPNLYQLTNFGPQSFVNATPVVADVHLPARDGKQLKIDGSAWRTVLVGGFKTGAKGYYALDITDPAHPIVLWEIDNNWQVAKYEDSDLPTALTVNDVVNKNINIEKSGSFTDGGYPFIQMGFSNAEPLITNMLIGNNVEPVAILPGGTSSITENENMTGKALYIVRLFPKERKDLLVKSFNFENRITGTPAVYPNNFNAVAQHIYVGDEKGRLFRISVKGNDPAQWGSNETDTVTSLSNTNYVVQKPAFDLAKDLGDEYQDPFSKITFAPAVSLYKQFAGSPIIQVAFGTGENDDFNIDSNAYHYVASFFDKSISGRYQFNPDQRSETGSEFKQAVYLLNYKNSIDQEFKNENDATGGNYKIYSKDPLTEDAVTNEKLTGTPITHNFTTYFPTFVQTAGSDPKCPEGVGHIWRIKTPAATKYKLVQNVQGTNDSDPYNSNGKEHAFIDVHNRVYGLEITEQIECYGERGAHTTYVPQLVFQSGNSSQFENKQTDAVERSDLSEISSSSIALDAVAPSAKPLFWASVYE